jgi:putative copper export protein
VDESPASAYHRRHDVALSIPAFLPFQRLDFMNPIEQLFSDVIAAGTSSLPLAADVPTMDAMMAARVLSRALHLICAIILGGGVFYLRTILAPSGAGACFGDRRAIWARWVGIASGILLLSGLFNFFTIINAAKATGDPVPVTYHIFFGIKFLLGLGVMFIMSLVAGKSAGAEKARQNLSRWLNIAWTSVMAIVILGAMMRMMHG